MKIAVLSSHTPSLFWFRMDMMTAFLDAGYEVVAIGNEPEEKWNKQFADRAIGYRQIYVERNGTNPAKDLKTLFSLKKVLTEEKIDRIFAYQAKTVIYGSIAAHQLGIKEIYTLIAGVGSVFLGHGIKNELVQTVLCLEYRIALRHCINVFFQNKDDSAVFIGKRILTEEKIVFINGSGVNIEKFIPSPVPETPTFLFIGRLIRDKGVEEYLDACRLVKGKNKNVRCLLVGPYDTNPSALKPEDLKKYIDDGSVEYFGEQADVRPYLNQCSVYVLPSYHEGTPKTVLEAMASGRAIITTDAPGCKETVTEGLNGYLVPVKNANSLANKMLYLANNHEAASRMGNESRTVAEQKYNVNIVNNVIMNTMKL